MDAKGYALASRMLVDGKMEVGFMYRDEPDGDFSGWCFFSGKEPEGYENDPDNIAIYSLDTIIGIDASVKPYLGSVPGMAFERAEGHSFYNAVDGFLDGRNGDA